MPNYNPNNYQILQLSTLSYNDIITFNNNIVEELLIQNLPIISSNALIYSAGGGSLFPSLQQDLVTGGNQNYMGNTVLNNQIQLKSCTSLNVTTQQLQVNSQQITRGLFTYNATTQSYYWDEVYTSPLGLYSALNGAATPAPTASAYNFYITNNNSNQLYLSTNDVNIVPKQGDYIVLQRAFNFSTSFSNTSYTNGTNQLPILTNTELYQFKINSVLINTLNGANSVYQLILDKSITIPFDSVTANNNRYIIVLLNRLNTGIQKELFYDTFEQVEIRREQLLGDPYNNTTDSTKPQGRKNYLNYNSSQYIGLSVLLKNIIVDGTTPFIVFDMNDVIKDRILPQAGELQFTLPFIMYNYDTRSITGLKDDFDLQSSNKVIEGGQILFEETGIGNYCGLYFKWDTLLQYRIGYVFYDLRIIVIDDAELATSLSYNSNRNYTLSTPILDPTANNNLINPGGRLNAPIVNITSSSSSSPVLVTTSIPNGLIDGSQVYISGANVIDANNNVIPSSANGYHYVVLLRPNGPSNPPDLYSFYLYDSTLTIPVTSNGTFYNGNPSGNGMVVGTVPDYSYFITYRMINKNYASTLPYSSITSFNFTNNGKIDNTSASSSVQLKIPKFKFLKDANNNQYGFDGSDIEIIIGQYQNSNVLEPNQKTGIQNVVSIPIEALTAPNNRTLFNGSGVQNDLYTNSIVITLSDYNKFVGLINSANAAYSFSTNSTGNTAYNIISNYKHYTYYDGSAVPNDIVTGYGLWTLGNILYQSSISQYRSSMQVLIPASQWNDTTNPTYDPTNPFITNRYISEVAITQTDVITGTEKPMIYCKISPAIKKSNDTDLQITMNLDF